MKRKRYQNLTHTAIVVDGQRYGRGETFVAAYTAGAEAALVEAGTLRVLEVLDHDEPVPLPPLKGDTAEATDIVETAAASASDDSATGTAAGPRRRHTGRA